MLGLVLVWGALGGLGVLAQGDLGSTSVSEPVRRSLEVGGLNREFLVAAPEVARRSLRPLIFIFHGHGGSAEQAVKSIGVHRHWPEAICVWMQGLPTPGQLTDPEGKRNGWQAKAGDQGDRDLLFFDAVLGRIRSEYRVDERQVFCTGHSNGGAFTYLLWAERGKVISAVAPSGAVASVGVLSKLTPKPVLHLAGEADALVKFSWQQRTMEEVRRINGCAMEPLAWGERGQWYRSSKEAPFVSYVHPGGHLFPSEAPSVIVRFFKEFRTLAKSD